MKVLYCAPEATNPNHYAYSNIRASFLQLGFELVDFDYLAEGAALGREGMVAKLEALVEAERPDLFYHAIIEDELPVDFLERLKAKPDLTTMVFFSDDDWRMPHSLQWVGHYDLATTNDSDALPIFHAHGHHHVRHVQYACNPGIYYPRAVEKRYDVTFVGAAYSGRPELVRALKEAGIDVRVWGPGWERYPDLRAIAGGILPTEIMIETFCASRIVLGFAWCSIWDGTGAMQPQIKGRTFEYPGCGAFQLTYEDARLAHYFEVGGEVATFRDAADLIEKVRYYLVHEEEREAIAQAGMARVLTEHTWEQRWRTFFADVIARPPEGKRPLVMPEPPTAAPVSSEPAPLVSVICYVYNISEYLDELVQSVQAQTFRNFEFVIIDDGSTDRTPEVIAPYLSDPRIRYFRQENVGKTGRFDLLIKAAMDRARGELIAFIGGDDVCMPERLERQVAEFRADPELDIVHTNGHQIGPDGKLLRTEFGLPAEYNGWSMTRILFNRNLVAHPTVMMRRRCFDRVGPFEEGFAADLHYWMKSARFLRYKYLPEKLMSYRIHPKSASTTEEGYRKAYNEANRLVRLMRPKLTILDLYPEIEHFEDKQLALAAAYVDFGNLLMTGSIYYPDLAAAEFQRALEHLEEANPAVYHNLAIALHHAGRQGEAAGILNELDAIRYAPTRETRAVLVAGKPCGDRLRSAREVSEELFQVLPSPHAKIRTFDGRPMVRHMRFGLSLTEDSSWEGALRAYCEAFRAGDPVDLCITVPAGDSDAATGRLLEGLEAWSFDIESLADLEVRELDPTEKLPVWDQELDPRPIAAEELRASLERWLLGKPTPNGQDLITNQ